MAVTGSLLPLNMRNASMNAKRSSLQASNEGILTNPSGTDAEG